MGKMCFVFGSNEAGIHGAGAAKTAYEKHGARMRFSYGHWGDSFAIPTKDQQLKPLPIQRIMGYVAGFNAYAAGHPELEFQVTRIGCGLAGFSDREMVAIFRFTPTHNCLFDLAWKTFFEERWPAQPGDPERRYWGTF